MKIKRYYAVSKQSLSSYENRAFGSIDDIRELMIYYNKNVAFGNSQFQLGISITNLPTLTKMQLLL